MLIAPKRLKPSDPLNLWALNADHTHLVHRSATNWAWSARFTKFVISRDIGSLAGLYWLYVYVYEHV